MAPHPQCAAVAAAQTKTGMRTYLYLFRLDLSTLSPGLSYAQIASKIGSTEEHVTDSEFLSQYP